MRAVAWPGAICLLLIAMTGSGSSEAGDRMMLASGRSDASAYAAGVGLSSLVKFELLPSKKIDLQAMESPGAVDNVRLLETGEAAFAILSSVVSHAARLGVGPFAGEPPKTGFRAIATLWRDALHLVVREDDVATGTIDDLQKLKNRKVFLGEAATGMVDVNLMLLSDLDLDPGRTFDLATVADGDGIAAIRRGEVDAFSSAARPPGPMFESVFKDAAPGLRLLDITEAQMARANGNHWLWTPYVIPAATYPGQIEDVWTIGLSNILAVRADVDPEIVYAITKSIFENLTYLKRVDPLMTDLALDTALAGLAMPLHAGALRYYDEVGLIPKPTSGDDLPAPTLTPVRQPEQPGVAPEHYPDADVAGSWPRGVGGPLLKSAPGESTSSGPADGSTPAPGDLPATTTGQPKPYWLQRATL